MFLETAAVQVRRENQDPLADFLDGLGDFVERRGEGLNVFALQRSNEGLAELFREFLGDSFVFPPAANEFIEALRRIVMLEFPEKINQVMDAAIGLLRASLEEIVKLFVVTEELADRKHNVVLIIACRGE